MFIEMTTTDSTIVKAMRPDTRLSRCREKRSHVDDLDPASTCRLKHRAKPGTSGVVTQNFTIDDLRQDRSVDDDHRFVARGLLETFEGGIPIGSSG